MVVRGLDLNDPVANGQDRALKLWDVATGGEVCTFRGHTDAIASVAFSPDGKRLATASVDKTVRVWEVATGNEVLSLKRYTDTVHSVAFSPDGKRLAAGGHDKMLKVWKLSD